MYVYLVWMLTIQFKKCSCTLQESNMRPLVYWTRALLPELEELYVQRTVNARVVCEIKKKQTTKSIQVFNKVIIYWSRSIRKQNNLRNDSKC